MFTDQDMMRLLGRVAVGDARAFRELYEGVSPKLFGVCLKLLRQRDQAEEALQETFVRIWHHASEYHEDRGSPLGWMATIARYRALDLLRKKRDVLADSESYLDTLADERPGPQEIHLQGVSSQALQGCLQELSEPQRNSIAMAYYQGLSHEELSSYLDTPLGTIKSWIRRGLISLKRCLER